MGDLLSKPRPLEEVITENKKMIRKAIRELDKEIRKNEKDQAKLTVDIKKNAQKNEHAAARIQIKDLIRSRKYLNRFIMMKTQLNSVALKIQTMKSQQAMTSAMQGKHYCGALTCFLTCKEICFSCIFMTTINTVKLMFLILLFSVSPPPFPHITLGVTGCLKMMNSQISTPEMAQIMQDFARENEYSEAQQDIMNDSIDDIMDEGAQEAEDKMFEQVMDELGLDFGNSLPDAGTAAAGGAAQTTAPALVAAPIGGGSSNGNDKDDGDGSGGGEPPAGGVGRGDPAMSELEARLNNLRR